MDGFPRTVRQAEVLEQLWPGAVRLCVALVVPLATISWRLVARGREDDQPAIVRDRVLSYDAETRQLLPWFAERGLLVHVDGNQPRNAVTAAMLIRLAEVGISPVA